MGKSLMKILRFENLAVIDCHQLNGKKYIKKKLFVLIEYCTLDFYIF